MTSLSMMTLVFPFSSTRGFTGNPIPTFHGLAVSQVGFQTPAIIGEPSGEWNKRQVEEK